MRRIGLAVVLTVSFALAPLAADAQQAGKVPRKGLHLQRSDLGPTHVAIAQGLNVQWRGPIAPCHHVSGED
jgi:hypothetical protein